MKLLSPKITSELISQISDELAEERRKGNPYIRFILEQHTENLRAIINEYDMDEMQELHDLIKKDFFIKIMNRTPEENAECFIYTGHIMEPYTEFLDLIDEDDEDE